MREARDLFLVAMAELGVQAPRDNSYEEMARCWAREMLAGSVSPYQAGQHISWRAWDPLGRPAELAAFVGLTSMWEDDPDHRAGYDEQLLREAERLTSGGLATLRLQHQRRVTLDGCSVHHDRPVGRVVAPVPPCFVSIISIAPLGRDGGR